jgi:hypothetical protein
VVERGRAVGPVEVRYEVREARERRQATEPATAPAGDAEVEPRAKEVDPGRVGFEQRDRRLCHDERDVALEPVPQPLALVRGRIGRRAEIDEDVVALERDREAAQLVRELVEGPAGCEVEARVVPVAGEDPIADGAAMKREAHVRAAVVDRVHLLAVGEQTHDVAVEMDDLPSGCAQLGERSGADTAI